MTELKPLQPEQWGPRQARHLLNRAGFGLPQSRWAHLSAQSPEQAVDEMVNFSPSDAPGTPDFILEPIARGDLKRQNPNADEPELQLIYQERQREEREAIAALQGWWMERMHKTPNPLEEKMVLFWHGHFATSAQKVRFSAYNHQLYEVFRANALGNLKALTIAVGQSVAMLDYLDNRKSSREKPNENWARELMELFTLGQGQYTEDDIKQSARAFTGWTINRDGFEFMLSRHDPGEKTFLGRTGNFDGWDIIDIIFEQPAASTFIAGKLWKFFAGDVEDKGVVEALAHTLRENNFEVRPVLAQMFASEVFYSEQVMAGQIKSPVQFSLQLCEDLGVTPPYGQLPRATRALGQDLFHPPNVKGWDGNRAWISANTLLIRYNLPATLLATDDIGVESDEPAMMGAALPQGRGKGMAAMSAAYAGSPPTKEERHAYFKEARKEALAKLKELPKTERIEKTAVLRDGEPAEKQALMRELKIAPPPWKTAGPSRLFDDLNFATAGECIDALAFRLLTPRIGDAQRSALLEIMGAADGNAPLAKSDLDEAKRVALLRLVTSMAEYQLC